jgi:hypothetical protein
MEAGHFAADREPLISLKWERIRAVAGFNDMHLIGALNMRNIFSKTCLSIAALGLGISLAASPVLAAGERHGGGGGGGFHSGGGHMGGGFHGGGGGARVGGGGFSGGASAFHPAHGGGGYAGGGGGYRNGYGHGNGYGYGYGGAALGVGLLGGAIIGSQYPYDDSGYDYGAQYDVGPQEGGGDSEGYCERTYRSYDPASGTYLGYDGLRHSCP